MSSLRRYQARGKWTQRMRYGTIRRLGRFARELLHPGAAVVFLALLAMVYLLRRG